MHLDPQVHPDHGAPRGRARLLLCLVLGALALAAACGGSQVGTQLSWDRGAWDTMNWQ